MDRRKNSRMSKDSIKSNGGMGSWVKKLYKSTPDGLSDLSYKGTYMQTFSPFSSQTSLFSSSGTDHLSMIR